MKETCSKNIQHNESRSYCIPNKQSQIIKIISKRLLFHLQEALLKNWIMTLQKNFRKSEFMDLKVETKKCFKQNLAEIHKTIKGSSRKNVWPG